MFSSRRTASEIGDHTQELSTGLQLQLQFQEQYRSTLESIGDPLHVVDRELRIILINSAFTNWNRTLGLAENPIGKNILEIFPFLPEHVRREYEEVFRSGRTLVSSESVNIDGAELFTETRKIPIIEDGRVIRVVTIIRDVTEKLHTERALHAYLERLESVHDVELAIRAARSLHEIAAAALGRLARLVPCQRASIMAFEERTGRAEILATHGSSELPDRLTLMMPPAEVIRARLDLAREVVCHDDLAEVETRDAMLSLALQHGMRSAVVVPLVAEDRLLGALHIASPTPGAFSPEHREIAAELGGQLAVALHEAGLRASLEQERQKLTTLVEQLPDGVVLLDHDRRILIANDLGLALLAILGCSGQDSSAADDGTTITELVEGRTDGLPLELTIDGPPRYVIEVRSRPFQRGAAATDWVLILRDVTAERTATQRLEQQHRLALFGQLAGGLAHDLNNVLTAIVTLPEILLQEASLDPRVRHALEVIEDQGKRGATLVRKMLDFSRLSATERQPIRILPFLHDIGRLLRRILPETIVIEINGQAATEIVVDADATQLQQVLLNLAVNARDAMPDGGTLTLAARSLEVSHDAYRPVPDLGDGEYFWLTVHDTGCGIAREHLSLVFEPFFTTKPVGEGTGLGLAQVYGLIKQHGGVVSVDSTLGQGTTFHIFLPTSTGPIATTVIEVPPMVREGAGQTLLIVEDEPQVRATLRDALSFLGYRTLEAGNGREALAVLASTPAVDAILTDVTMPEMDGIELVRHVRALRPELPTVALTGHLADRLGDQLRAVGVTEIMQKPASLAELSTTLDRLLRPSRT